MIDNHFNVVTDGQWGSCGKGLITTAIAARHRPEILSTTSMANAGHTAVWDDGRKFIAKALPSAAILNAWLPDYHPSVMVGASAAFFKARMLEEIQECQLGFPQILIHPRSGVITERHQEFESRAADGTKHIASTMQGCGAFLADKVLRRAHLKLARDYEELAAYYRLPDPMHEVLNTILIEEAATILHEGSQGFSLDINHGSHYPQCTSRGTSAVNNIADMGIHPRLLGDVYLVIRPYPIRVGNVVENGETVGYSGDAYPGQVEMTWRDVAWKCGAPPEVMNGELTTVTKRLRRVFSFSMRQLKEAILVNGATQIALNFANYLDWGCYGCNDFEGIIICYPKIRDFVNMIEDETSVPVTILGTGPQNNHVAFKE